MQTKHPAKKIDFAEMLRSLSIPIRTEGAMYQAGEIGQFARIDDTHGHARNAVATDPFTGPAPRMITALATTNPFHRTQIWMPNLNPGPITTAGILADYFKELKASEQVAVIAYRMSGWKPFKHHIALRLDASTSKQTLEEAATAMDELGMIRICKIYPDGVTTNSAGGWTDLSVMYEAIEYAADLGYTICLHGEQPGKMIDTYSREEIFAEKSFLPMVQKFQGARFSLEHISTAAGIDAVMSCDWNKVRGGITLQHLVLTRNDVLECDQLPGHKGLNGHNHCRPPAQTFNDQKKLLVTALNADRYYQFGYGSDSAPWFRESKECATCCAGVMSSPVAAPVLISLFEAAGRLDTEHFHAFLYGNAQRYYGGGFLGQSLSTEDETFVLTKESWIVPASYGGIVPLYAGCELPWKPMDEHILNPLS
jgi:dihydroorotase